MTNPGEFDFNVCGILAAQGYLTICSHIDIVNRYNASLFVELGMFIGGTLPHMLPNLVLDPEFSYVGFEISAAAVSPRLKKYAVLNPRCKIVLEDMFEPHNMDLVRNAIQTSKRTAYIFCDGGNKPKELEVFSKMLRVGDIISVHDYTLEQTGEIKDKDFAVLGDCFAPLDEAWRKNTLILPTFIRIK